MSDGPEGKKAEGPRGAVLLEQRPRTSPRGWKAAAQRAPRPSCPVRAPKPRRGPPRLHGRDKALCKANGS